jgi:hypothetical protein
MQLPITHEAMLERRIVEDSPVRVVVEEVWDMTNSLCPFIFTTAQGIIQKNAEEDAEEDMDNHTKFANEVPMPTDELSIQEAYPPERHYIEMTLVRMMHGRMSWADYCDINQALNNIRMHAEDMERERRMFETEDMKCNGCASEPQWG